MNDTMRRLTTVSSVLMIASAFVLSGPVAKAEIAGLNPSVRPKDAPVITEYPKSKDWYVAALSGVLAPYPQSLNFLDSQGAWFTPFIHPGMTAPYDLRGWHAGDTPQNNNQ